MNLFNYIVILGKSLLWTCQCRETLLSLSHFIRILVNKLKMRLKNTFISNRIRQICVKKNGRFLMKQFQLLIKVDDPIIKENRSCGLVNVEKPYRCLP